MMKKVKIEVWKEIEVPSRAFQVYDNASPDLDIVFRINLFFGHGKYFLFYSGFTGRMIKRNTWLIRLIKRYRNDRKRLQILKDVRKEPGRYDYKVLYVSPYLMRNLLNESNKPESFNEVEEVYEN
jgi:hypothetical protein